VRGRSRPWRALVARKSGRGISSFAVAKNGADGQQSPGAALLGAIALCSAALVLVAAFIVAWIKTPDLLHAPPDYQQVPRELAGPTAQVTASYYSAIATIRTGLVAGLAGLAAVAGLAINIRSNRQTENARRAELDQRNDALRSELDQRNDALRSELDQRNSALQSDLDQRNDALQEELRQRRTEAQATEHDARERRITELYTKAVDQLGSKEAPVRLGGLYALERLAEITSGQRLTIVNVICAYLRMPYTPTPDDAYPVRGTQQDREVRVAAQRVLVAHLRPAEKATFWGILDVNLSGAHLIDFSLSGCQVASLNFDSAKFTGATDFSQVVVEGVANFKSADFNGSGRNTPYRAANNFNGARFDVSDFSDTTFAGRCDFNHAVFGAAVTATTGSITSFDSATFSEWTTFNNASFNGETSFVDATFKAGVSFQCTFYGNAWFTNAKLNGSSTFSDGEFHGEGSFWGTEFNHRVAFERAIFYGVGNFEDAFFSGERGETPDFRRAEFRDAARFSQRSFPLSVRGKFDNAIFCGRIRFAPWVSDSGSLVPEEFVGVNLNGAWVRLDEAECSRTLPSGWEVEVTDRPSDKTEGTWGVLRRQLADDDAPERA
jgi:hypothetical protein